MSQENAAHPPASGTQSLRSVHTKSLPQLLESMGATLAVTTYQSGHLVFARVQDGALNTHFRQFPMPMGIAHDGMRFALGTKTQVHEFRNAPVFARGLEPKGRHDACFLPRVSHVTGDIRIHEIAYAGDELWVVNTRFSCLATLDRDSCFVPRWRPRWVTGLSGDDRCHLNGFCVVDGAPKYVSAVARTNEGGAWRAHKNDGGVIVDVPTDEVVLEGLNMPHSPRWHDGRLWLLEAGTGRLCVADLKTGTREVVAELPGFARGLDMVGPYAFVGLSKARESSTFGGLPITEPGRERHCGVWVVDIRSGQVVAFLRFEEHVQEVFAVHVLQGVRYPELLVDDDAIAGAFVLPESAMKDVGR